MKKVLAILLVLVVAMTGVMAGEGDVTDPYSSGSATVTLKSKIQPISYFGVAKASANVEGKTNNDLGSITGNPWGSGVDFDSVFTTPSTFYFGYITNLSMSSSSMPSVSVAVTPFVKEGVSSATDYQKVGYTIAKVASEDDKLQNSANQDVSSVAVDASSASQTLNIEFTSAVTSGGLRAEEIGLTVTVDDGWKTAETGAYVATITFSVTNL